MKKSDITKQKILTAAEAEFSEKGMFGARIDAIAETAGVNKRMIYQHYINKEELYKTVLSGAYSKLAEYERGYYLDDVPPDVAIKNIVYGSFGFLRSNPEFVRILMWENLNNGKYLTGGDVSRIKDPTIEYIKSRIELGKAQGLFRPDADVGQVVISLLNFEFSYFANIYTLSSVLSRQLDSDEEIENRAHFIADIILKYLYK